MLFGKDPGRFYSNLSVKIGKFGNSDADLVFHEVTEGNIIQLKHRIEEILSAKFFSYPVQFEGMQRIEKDEYPVLAVREMIMNALVHRNYMGAPTQIRLYDTHFSVWNDGGLPEGITERDLRTVHRSKPRNPLIADVCFKAGYIDSWGSGTVRIIETCRNAELPEPELREEQGGFLGKIFKDLFTEEQLQKMGLNERQIKAVQFIKQNNRITNSEYQKISSVSERTALRDLEVLKARKLLIKKGEKKGSYYQFRKD